MESAIRAGYGTAIGASLYLSHPSSLEHDTGGHPENADRIRALEAELESRGWLGLERLEAPAATREALERVHSAEHVDLIESFSAQGGGMIDADTVASPGSWRAALHAAGGAVEAVDRLLGGDAAFAFCALRPPGHHAEAARAMGFCLFNNVAVAAAHALAEHGVERVLVLDWDVHHGNGTNEIFSDSAEVLYASIHQMPLYPGSGAAGDVGRGAGEGFTLNLPVAPGAGPDEFCSLVQNVVVPVLGEYRPGLVCVSAGFDAHRDDPLANCGLDEDAYADMAASLRDAAAEVGAPVLVCLEGGYDLRALSASACATIEAFTGERIAREAPSAPADEHRQRLARWWGVLA